MKAKAPTAQRLALKVTAPKGIFIRGRGHYANGAVVGYVPSLASAFLLAIENGLGDLTMLDAALLSQQEAAPWPDESGCLCGSVIPVGSTETFEGRRVLYRMHFIDGLAPSDRESFRLATGLLSHKFRAVRTWPAELPEAAQPWLARSKEFEDSKIRVDRQRAERNARAAQEAERRLFATFAERAAKARAEAEELVRRAAELEDQAKAFTAAKVKTMAELSAEDRAAVAAEERRIDVRRIVNAALLEVARVESAGVVKPEKVARAKSLANDAAAKFGAGDLDGALTAAQQVSAELEAESITGDGALPAP